MRLIDAISLLDNHTKTIRVRGKLIGYVTFEDISNAPTVDAVEVVRCKDCKNCEKDRLFGGLWCRKIRGENGFKKMPNWFCADGERRTDE